MLRGHAHVLRGAQGGGLWIDLIGWHGGQGLLGAGWTFCGCCHVGSGGDKLSSQLRGALKIKLLCADWCPIELVNA